MPKHTTAMQPEVVQLPALHFTRAYKRVLGEVYYAVVTYKQPTPDVVEAFVASDWMPDDGFDAHTSAHMKSFKLSPDCARVFIPTLAVAPYLVPASVIKPGKSFTLAKQA